MTPAVTPAAPAVRAAATRDRSGTDGGMPPYLLTLPGPAL